MVCLENFYSDHASANRGATYSSCVRRRDGGGLVDHVECHRRNCTELQALPRAQRHAVLLELSQGTS